MSGGLIIPDKQTAKALNDLARHKTILRLLQDIRIDMEICEIEGWDKTEYLTQIKQLINSMGGTAEMTELKPCPFCGGSAQCTNPTTWQVWCAKCGAIGPWKITREEAIEAWNRRAAKEAAEVEHE